MADIFSKEQRSMIMSKIRSKDTKIEVLVRKELWKLGHRGYRIHSKMLGSPDIIFPKKKVAIFIDGDFFHGYNWKCLGKVPPKKYWQAKIQKNMDRDKRNNRALRKDGWKVLRLWEHDIHKNFYNSIKKIERYL